MTINFKAPEIKELQPRLLVLGVGGAGGNAINEMIENNFNLDDIDKSIQAFDEPYCDPSTVPSYYLSKEMSKYIEFKSDSIKESYP